MSGRGRARIERHAANHLPGGSDPITGVFGWRFNVVNQEPGGGYGIVVFDDHVAYSDAAEETPRSDWAAIFWDKDGNGIVLLSSDIDNDQHGLLWATPDNVRMDISDGPTVGITRDFGDATSGAYAFLHSGETFRVIDASANVRLRIDDDGALVAESTSAGPTGWGWDVLDSDGNGIRFVSTDGDITSYTRVQPELIENGLGAGSIFYIVDSDGAPILQIVEDTGLVQLNLASGGSVQVYDSSNALIFEIDEATGLTTCTLDGGGP